MRKGYLRIENGALVTLTDPLLASKEWTLTIAYRSWDNLAVGDVKELIDLPVGSLKLIVLTSGADLQYVN